MTALKDVYDSFFTLITDDLYLEISPEETERDCYSLLLASLPLFEFPNAVIDIVTVTDEYGLEHKEFNRTLTLEEINILAYGMVQIWLQRQLTSIEAIRQKMTGSDFKVSSQAAHLSKLMTLMQSTKDEHRRLQMLYSRRAVDGNGGYQSTFGKLVQPRTPWTYDRYRFKQ